MQLPKIKIGSQVNSVSKLNLSHDSNFTAQFGRVGCATILECLPKSKTTIKVNSLLRMAPMVVPTTTRIRYEVFHRFVPFSDLYEPYENLLSGNSYGTAVKSYLPTSVPLINSSSLCALLFNYGWCSAFIKYNDDEWRQLVTNTEKEDAIQAYCQFFNLNLDSEQWLPSFSTPFTDSLPSSSSSTTYSDVNYINPDGADFVFKYSVGSNEYMFLIRLSDDGKFIRSVLLGLGYNLDPADYSSLSALPIFAYCKAYFDTFYPQQNISWTNTIVYQLLDYIRVNNVPASVQTKLREWTDVFAFIAGAYFTDNNDFVSAHISTPSKASAVTFNVNDEASLGMISGGTSSDNTQPALYSQTQTANRIRSLLRLQTLSNLSTVVGGKISDFLKIQTGSSELHNKDSYFIGHSSIVVGVEDINNMTASSNAYLGEYAGKGIGKTSSPKKISYENSNIGYWVVLTAVVPEGNFFQGQAPHLFHRTRMEQYFPQFDGLGYEVTPMNMIMADNAVSSRQPSSSLTSFGFIPQYTSFKFHNNVVAGDLSLRSTRKDMLPYTIDKFITPNDLDVQNKWYIEDGSYKKAVLDSASFVNTTLPIASTEWRFINKYKWLANYDRIFPNGVLGAKFTNFGQQARSLHDDPFFVFNYLEVTQYAHVKPIAESFDTEGESGKTVEVQKQ